MNFKPIFFINGILLLIMSAAMFFPVVIDFSDNNDDWKVFAGAQIVTAFFGFALMFSTQQKKFSLSLRETFLMTCMSWLTLSVFGALPFFFSSLELSVSAALFESTSGITTTGATVISGLNELPRGILLWRSILQWMGGIGVLVIALAVLPLLQISGMQIYKTQSFGEIDKVLPSATQIAVYILLIYFTLTLSCTVLLHFAGMNLFDALNHGMTSVSTGGFSTKDTSIGFFQSRPIELITILFMLSGALPFVLYVKFLRGDHHALFRDSQVRTFFKIILICIAALTLYLVLTGRFYFIDALTKATFMVTTLITSTSYVSGDYTSWGPFVVAMAFLITFLGGCSGSTSGGIKIFRLQILWKMMQQQLNKLITPHAIFQVSYHQKPVDFSLQAAIAGFFFVYITTWIFFGIALQTTGLDFVTAFSASLMAVSNAGIGLGHLIGPAGNFSPVNDSALSLLSLAMLLGRLEFFTALVLLLPRFWRR
jgi:trk system potassium uptake protein TrkH